MFALYGKQCNGHQHHITYIRWSSQVHSNIHLLQATVINVICALLQIRSSNFLLKFSVLEKPEKTMSADIFSVAMFLDNVNGGGSPFGNSSMDDMTEDLCHFGKSN